MMRLGFGQTGVGGAAQQLAQSGEAGAVAGAVPAFFQAVPVHYATQVGADGRALVGFALLVFVHSYFSESPAQHGAVPGRYLVGRLHVATGQQLGVFDGHVGVFDEVLLGALALHRYTAGVVEDGPGVVAAFEQVGYNHGAQRAVRHAVARVAGDDVHVVAVERIATGVAQPIHWLHHLARPAVLNAFHGREPGTGPLLQAAQAGVGVVVLPGFVVFAAHNQQVVVDLPAAGAGLHFLGADVVVRVGRIPEQRLSYRTFGNARPDDVGAVRRLLGVHHHPVVERCVRRHYDAALRLHLSPIFGHHPGRVAAVHFAYVGEGADAPAQPHNGLGQAGEVFQNVKLPLVGPAQAFPSFKTYQARAGQPLHVGEAGPVRGGQLVFQLFVRATGGQKQIAVEPGEVAVNFFLQHNLLNPVNSRGVAFTGQACALLPKEVFEGGVPVVEGIG